MAPEYIPMTPPARDALIAISFLWVLFLTVVTLRLVGRAKGAGIGADDVLSAVACVRSQPAPQPLSFDAADPKQALSGSTIGFNSAVFVSGVGYDFDEESEVFPKRESLHRLMILSCDDQAVSHCLESP